MDKANLNTDDFVASLQRIHAGADKTKSPGAFYSQDGDAVFYYAESGAHYAEYVDPLLTVYRSIGGRHIVGLELKNIRRLKIDGVQGEICSEMGKPQADTITLLLLSLTNQSIGDAIEKHEAAWKRAVLYAEAARVLGGDRVEVQDLLAAAA